MQVELYTKEQIDMVIELIEFVQDGLEVEDPDILWQALEEVVVELIDIEEDEE